MKPRGQSILIGLLIVLLVCQPMIRPVTNYLMLPLGRILVFGASAYVGLTVNPVIGLLMAFVALQAISEFYLVEHMTMDQYKALLKFREKMNALAGASCECPTGYEFDADHKKCKNKEDKYVNPTACRCDPGYAYNIKTGLCEQNSVMSSPIPAVAPAPEGTEEVAPTLEVKAPAAFSVEANPIPISSDEKDRLLGKLAPAE